MDYFQKALDFTLKWEGGYVNDPDDMGGATNRGVTQGTYNRWRINNKLPIQPVKNITAEEVRTIYRKGYWDIWESWGVREALQIAVFDTSVNMGTARTGGMLKESGKDLKKFLTLRFHKYIKFASVPTQGKYLVGWLNRLNALCKLLDCPLGIKYKPEKWSHL